MKGLTDNRPILLGSPVRFSDRWRGRVTALEVDKAWEVLNVFVSSGLFKPVTVKLPMAAAAWDEDHVAFPEVASVKAFKREVPPVAAAARTISAQIPISMPGARLAGAIVESSSRRAVEILFTRNGGVFRLEVGQISFQGKEMRITAQTDTLTPYRSDGELVRAAKGALARTYQLTADERLAVAVAVVGDRVHLSGNVLTPRSREAAMLAVRHAAAPAPVCEAIADDLSLEFAVSRALQRGGACLSSSVYPRSSLGQVILFGHATSAAAAVEAGRVASQVPGVRSLQSRIDVASRAAAV